MAHNPAVKAIRHHSHSALRQALRVVPGEPVGWMPAGWVELPFSWSRLAPGEEASQNAQGERQGNKCRCGERRDAVR